MNNVTYCKTLGEKFDLTNFFYFQRFCNFVHYGYESFFLILSYFPVYYNFKHNKNNKNIISISKQDIYYFFPMKKKIFFYSTSFPFSDCYTWNLQLQLFIFSINLYFHNSLYFFFVILFFAFVLFIFIMHDLPWSEWNYDY